MDIGIFGLWGMNVTGRTFGGFENVYTEVGSRLAAAGHKVTIYSRRSCYPEHLRVPSHRGVTIRYVPTVDTKSLSFLTATTFAVCSALIRREHDLFLFANVGSGWHCLTSALFGKKVILNVDGLDWLRPKWNSLGQLYFRLAAKAALFGCDVLITDADAMVDYYRRNFDRQLDMISYGAFIRRSENPLLLEAWGLNPRSYYLVVTRLIPDNNIHIIVDAFRELKTSRQLIIVGDANYDGPYQEALRSVSDPRIRFVGRIHSQDQLDELYCNSFSYIHGHSVGGTNPALLRALGCGAPTLALRTVFNEEVLDDGRCGLFWEADAQSLLSALQRCEGEPECLDIFRVEGPARIKEFYNWNKITRQYEALFAEVVAGRSDGRGRVRILRLLALLLVVLGLLAILH